MPAKSEFSAVRLMGKFCLAAERQGFTPKLLNDLAQNHSLLRKVRLIQSGLGKIDIGSYIVDCDLPPDGCYRILKHVSYSPFRWDLNLFDLWNANVVGCPGGGHIIGADLFPFFSSEEKPVLNLNIAVFLYMNDHLIPGNWRPHNFLFCGTILNHHAKGECIPEICRPVNDWVLQWRPLREEITKDDAVLVFKQQPEPVR